MDNTHIYKGISILLLGYLPPIASWVLQLLMTVSSATIPVLHSAEVVPFTHKSCYPSAKGSRLPIHLYRGGEAG
jgi:hypothetical protein